LSEDDPSAIGTPPVEDLGDLYEHAPCGYLSILPNGCIFKVNATFSTWVGFSGEQLLGKHLHDLLNVAGRIFFETHFAPLLRMQGFFNEVALDLITQLGARLPVLVNATERRDADGTHLFTRLTVFNATDRRRYERELLDARAAAEATQKELQALNIKVQSSLLDERETAELREQFIAVLGHDLRNPLAAISGGVELLRREPLNAKSARMVDIIEKSAGRMKGLIDDVMDFARGQLGSGLSLDLKIDQLLTPILQQVVTELRISFPGRVIDATIDISDPIYCDSVRVAQLLSNLLGNALMYGAPDLPIRVCAGRQEASFTLSVANGGRPIPPAAMERLFQPFTRGAVRPSQQGLGLGLFIAFQVAKAHGGTLEVESSPEETRFTFCMPLRDSAIP
jgi:sigma-B regulation protein RsbU (phosphoserine phosphatase)